HDKSLTLSSYDIDGNFALFIDGVGIGIDYSSESEVPWAPIKSKVNQIEIENGIEYIGDYYFTGIDMNSIILPKSVTCVSKCAFDPKMTVYTYGTDISDISNDVYYYSESQPTTSGNFFHMIGGKPVVWSDLKANPNVLFIGNSFTWRQNSETDPAVPKYFKAISDNLNYEVSYDFVVRSSYRLSSYADPNDELGKVVEQKLTTNHYDYVILQEQSTTPLSNYNSFLSAVTKLKSRIDETQNDCQTILYETWGSPASASTYGGSVGEMENRLRTAYTNCANATGCRVNYVGKVFTYVYENVPSITIYADDDRHQSSIGAYLSAAAHVRSVFGFKVSKCTNYCGFNNENAKTLLGIVDEIL
ncbi:MAG: leucine-rich repeat domain-containing protein, partial [Bacilli bacterium]|nr:leucine-rich repeat domain-containing protein [Bacilli bacterium]